MDYKYNSMDVHYFINIIRRMIMPKKVTIYQLDKETNTVKTVVLDRTNFIDTNSNIMYFANKHIALSYAENNKGE